ncbi:Mbeg1-like protein [Lysobacter fragariae]
MVWCNTRYLDAIPEHQPPFSATKSTMFPIAKRGYPYALASTLVLQDGGGLDHAFSGDQVLTRVDWLTDANNGHGGFYAATFTRKLGNEMPDEVIVAFRGTNDTRDWLLHNLSPFPEQYRQARRYVERVASALPVRTRLVVTGHSLGGGLAAHVAQHRDTRDLVQEAWVFNPSPRDGVWTHETPNIWFASSKGEILNAFRWDYVGAPKNQRTTEFKLIDASSVYRHFRYVITREILHYADLTEHVEGGRKSTTTIPLQILERSDGSRCSPEYAAKIVELRKAYDIKFPNSPEDNGQRSSGPE